MLARLTAAGDGNVARNRATAQPRNRATALPSWASAAGLSSSRPCAYTGIVTLVSLYPATSRTTCGGTPRASSGDLRQRDDGVRRFGLGVVDHEIAVDPLNGMNNVHRLPLEVDIGLPEAHSYRSLPA